MVHAETSTWSVELAADQVAALFRTFSDWDATEVERAASWVRGHGGSVLECCATTLLAALPAASGGEVEASLDVGGPCHDGLSG